MREGVGVVRDWMTRDPVVVSPAAQVGQVVGLMRGQGIRHVLVMDGEELVGIVSDRDVRGLSAASTVVHAMSEIPFTVEPATGLTEAAHAMLDRKIGALPVLDGARPVGILTRADALEALLAWADAEQRPPAR